jgi:hypothetical protein
MYQGEPIMMWFVELIFLLWLFFGVDLLLKTTEVREE